MRRSTSQYLNNGLITNAFEVNNKSVVVQLRGNDLVSVLDHLWRCVIFDLFLALPCTIFGHLRGSLTQRDQKNILVDILNNEAHDEEHRLESCRNLARFPTLFNVCKTFLLRPH